MNWAAVGAYVADKFVGGMLIGAGSAVGSYWAVNRALKGGQKLARRVKTVHRKTKASTRDIGALIAYIALGVWIVLVALVIYWVWWVYA